MSTAIFTTWNIGDDPATHRTAAVHASDTGADRPAARGNADEVAEARQVTMELRHGAVAVLLSRQAMPTLDRSDFAPASGVAKGAYVLTDPTEGEPEVILIASGTEVSLCLEAREQLSGQGVRARVVSMPSRNCSKSRTGSIERRCCPRRSGPGFRSSWLRPEFNLHPHLKHHPGSGMAQSSRWRKHERQPIV